MSNEKKYKVFPRSLARKMAKAQLDRRGATGYNRPGRFRGKKTPSTFSKVWRSMAVEATRYSAPGKGKRR